MGAVTLSSLFSMRFTRRSGRRKPAFGIVTGVAKRRIDSTMIFILGQGTDGYDTSRVDGISWASCGAFMSPQPASLPGTPLRGRCSWAPRQRSASIRKVGQTVWDGMSLKNRNINEIDPYR